MLHTQFSVQSPSILATIDHKSGVQNRSMHATINHNSGHRLDLDVVVVDRGTKILSAQSSEHNPSYSRGFNTEDPRVCEELCSENCSPSISHPGT